MSELRWNPLLGEWVATATQRQERTFMPPADFCPLCPTKPGGFPTEVPESAYDIVVFENRFPSLRPDPPAPSVEGSELYPVRPACGVCEVVLYSPEHNTTLADQSVEHIHHLVRVWRDRYEALGVREEVKYVFIFENKGEVGDNPPILECVVENYGVAEVVSVAKIAEVALTHEGVEGERRLAKSTYQPRLPGLLIASGFATD